MALFRRNRNENVLPEVKEYYEAERRDRSGVAWLLAGLTLVVAVLIVTGLFFGGRALYRAIRDNDEPVAVEEGGEGEQAPSTDGSNSGEQSGQPAEGQPETPPATSEPAPAPSTTPSTGTSSTSTSEPSGSVAGTSTSESSLPGTGPGDTAAIVISVTIAGATAHYVYSRRRILR
jgi:hypothetical protein